MANTWFQFKQFIVHQDACAMKVTTDACLFGAWVALHLQRNNFEGNVVDVGAGTGVLSLMIAQANPALSIDAVEIEEAAAAQASSNAAQSSFNHQITIHHADFLKWENSRPVNALVSNPPFHEQQLSGPDHKKNAAHHSSHLLLADLVKKADSLLSPGGTVYLLLPFYRLQDIKNIAADVNLQPVHICHVQQSPKHDFFRIMIQLRKTGESVSCTEENICITNEHHQYTDAFTQLLRPYYLKL